MFRLTQQPERTARFPHRGLRTNATQDDKTASMSNECMAAVTDSGLRMPASLDGLFTSAGR
jgi:hypothetical protein